MIFVDTNYFLRFLRNDIPEQAVMAKKLFLDAAAGKETLLTSTVVFFEIYWVIWKFYHTKKNEILKPLQEILEMNFIVIEERRILTQALEVFGRTGLDFEDCYNLAFSMERNAKEFKTFDKKIMRYLKALK